MAQRLKTVLSGNPELRPLLGQAQALTALQRQFNGVALPYLGPHLAQSCQVLGLHPDTHGDTLVIAVANATIAAKLRQLAPQLVILLQNSGWQVSGIRVRVQVSFAGSPAKTPPRKLGVAAHSALQELSSTLKDSPLKLALENFARKK